MCRLAVPWCFFLPFLHAAGPSLASSPSARPHAPPDPRPFPPGRYTRQSEKYNARLRARHQPPRYWPINTLSSPFCNRAGYGQDQYPDHMRLRTTYGTVHAPAPKQPRGPVLKKLYL